MTKSMSMLHFEPCNKPLLALLGKRSSARSFAAAAVHKALLVLIKGCLLPTGCLRTLLLPVAAAPRSLLAAASRMGGSIADVGPAQRNGFNAGNVIGTEAAPPDCDSPCSAPTRHIGDGPAAAAMARRKGVAVTGCTLASGCRQT